MTKSVLIQRIKQSMYTEPVHRMLYFPVPRQSLPGMLDNVEFPHITLLYLGTTTELSPDIDVILDNLAILSVRGMPQARWNGVARFSAVEEGRNPFVMLVDSEDLLWYRVEAEQLFGIGASEHGFIPHVTHSYLAPEEPLPFDYVGNDNIPLEYVGYAEGENRWCYRM